MNSTQPLPRDDYISPTHGNDQAWSHATKHTPLMRQLITDFPRELRVHALAYNWAEEHGTVRVELDVLTERNAPIVFRHPLVVYGNAGRFHAPPIEGLLVHAVLHQRKPDQSFVLSQAQQAQGPIHGVYSQAYRVRDWTQQDLDDLIGRLSKSGVPLAALSIAAQQRALMQGCMEPQWEALGGILQPKSKPWLSRNAPIFSTRPQSWRALRNAGLSAQGKRGVLVTDSTTAEDDQAPRTHNDADAGQQGDEN